MLKTLLKELRIEKGKTQAELALALNLARYIISNWEQGRTEPNATQLTMLADYFEVSTDYLLGRSDETGIVRSNANLAPDEAVLLDLYRQMCFQDKNQLKGFAKALVY